MTRRYVFPYFPPLPFTSPPLQENQYTLDFLGAIDGAKDKTKEFAVETPTANKTTTTAAAKATTQAGEVAGVVPPAAKRKRLVTP